jgi:hypothetical protein
VLGREPAGGGIDLLADFPDLQQKVAEAQLTREDALELAHSRRDKAARERRDAAPAKAAAHADANRRAAEGRVDDGAEVRSTNGRRARQERS